MRCLLPKDLWISNSQDFSNLLQNISVLFVNEANIRLEYKPAKIVLRPKIEFLQRRKNKETKPLSVNK